MRLFVDTSSLPDLKKALATGFVEGLTTNPALLSKDDEISAKKLQTIAELVPGPVSIQVMSENEDEMVVQGAYLASLAPNVAVKVPCTLEGFKATRALTQKGVDVNVTLCFSALHAMMAADAGAAYVSPFMGRLEAEGGDGIKLIEDIRTLYDTHGFETQILAASIRSTAHIEGAALKGADAATLPMRIFWELFPQSMVDKGLEGITPHYGSLQKKILT